MVKMCYFTIDARKVLLINKKGLFRIDVNNPYCFQRSQRLLDNGELTFPVCILQSFVISTFHTIAGKESAIHVLLVILNYLS